MKIQKLEFKNFQSYGNNVTELDFRDQSDMVLILGNNGHGKSAIAKVITVLCYGKCEGVKQGEIPNRYNKNFWGRITLLCGDKHVVIERGISPDIFNVWIDGKAIDTAGKINVQQYLENEVFGIPYTIFTNMIVLSINDFKSFIVMTPKDKRDIIDRLFGLSILNNIAEEVKAYKKNAKADAEKIIAELNAFESNINSVNEKLKQLDEKVDDYDVEADISELKSTEELLQKCNAAILKGKAKLKEKSDERSQAIAKRDKAKTHIDYITESLKLYDSGKCPTCGADLNGEEHQEKRRQLVEKRDKYVGIKTELNETISELSERIDIINDKLTNLETKTRSNTTKMYELKHKIDSHKDKAENERASLESLRDEFGEKLLNKKDEQTKVNSKASFLNILGEIFSDGGVKNYILQNIVPVLNKTAHDILEKFNLGYTVRFDDDLDCKVYSMNVEIGYKTLSTGERKKLDFVVVLTFLEVLKLKFPSINLLFLDEVFSNIDPDGINDISEILSDIADRMKLNVFVINHVPVQTAYFNRVLRVSKTSGFSEILIDDEN